MSGKRSFLKTLPGIAVSCFFLWFTFHGISYRALTGLRLVSPMWLLGVAGFLLAGYTLRAHRWWKMLQYSSRSSFGVCARVLMTSFAANNILPFRIGDIMRVFTYAGDLGASTSVVMGTVVLERMLDIFTLLLIFVATMGHSSQMFSARGRLIAFAIFGAVSAALLVLMLGARLLEPLLKRVFARLPQGPKVVKLEQWLLIGLDGVRNIGVAGTLWLMAESIVIWACEGMIFLSVMRMIGIGASSIAAVQALVFSNLSYLIPSSPGAVGTFETAATIALTGHGVPKATSAIYAVLVHVIILGSVTAVGGAFFLAHRYHVSTRKSLRQEISTLPQEIV